MEIEEKTLLLSIDIAKKIFFLGFSLKITDCVIHPVLGMYKELVFVGDVL